MRFNIWQLQDLVVVVLKLSRNINEKFIGFVSTLRLRVHLRDILLDH